MSPSSFPPLPPALTLALVGPLDSTTSLALRLRPLGWILQQVPHIDSTAGLPTAAVALLDLRADPDPVATTSAAHAARPTLPLIALLDRAPRRLALDLIAAGAADVLTGIPGPAAMTEHVTDALLRADTALQATARTARLEALVEQQAGHIQRLTMISLSAMANALDLRDSHTHGHSRRVARLVEATARALDLSPADVESLVIGATLHDIGKLALPDAILFKTSDLSDDERMMVRTHPTRGAMLVEPLLVDHPLALEAIRFHHERLDGSGYPHALAGDTIPLSARIVGVADTYDAITAGRPYAPARTRDEALAVLHRAAHQLFDPEVVTAFTDIVGDGDAPSPSTEPGDDAQP